MYCSRRIAACILARQGSHRLPGKMLLPFGTGTVLSSVIERLKACRSIDEIILATSRNRADDAIEKAGREQGIPVVRGDENDVVARMMQAVSELREVPDVVIRACADNPLVMPSVINEGVCELIDEDADIITPFEYATYPFGYGFVAMKRQTLERIEEQAREPLHREHVENYCLDHPEDFRVRYQLSPQRLELPELSVTLDYEIDYERLLAFESLLRDVPYAEQPRKLIDHARAGRVWVQGLSQGPPTGHDLVLATSECPAQATRGVVVVDTFDCHGEERYGLRYASDSPWATGRPLFLDAGANTQRESPQEFLLRTVEACTSSLLAGPLPAMTSPDGVGSTKTVAPTRRRGFHHASQALFPAEVVLNLTKENSGIELIETLLTELERHPEAQLVIGSDAGSNAQDIARLAKMRLGSDRVACLEHPDTSEDAFQRIVIDNIGHLMVGSAGATENLDASSIENFWRSPSTRRLRAETLNAESCG